jgi:hypothetical protein
MAGNGEANGNLKAHQESYDRFIWWLKTGTILSAITTALVIFLLTQ